MPCTVKTSFIQKSNEPCFGVLHIVEYERLKEEKLKEKERLKGEQMAKLKRGEGSGQFTGMFSTPAESLGASLNLGTIEDEDEEEAEADKDDEEEQREYQSFKRFLQSQEMKDEQQQQQQDERPDVT